MLHLSFIYDKNLSLDANVIILDNSKPIIIYFLGMYLEKNFPKNVYIMPLLMDLVNICVVSQANKYFFKNRFIKPKPNIAQSITLISCAISNKLEHS